MNSLGYKSEATLKDRETDRLTNAGVEAAKVYSKECCRGQRCEGLWAPF